MGHFLFLKQKSLIQKRLFRTKSLSFILKDGGGDSELAGGLRRNLRFIDLVALGIAAIIGAGIFSTIGNASFNGGPAISLLFIFTAIACSFSAMCYAEFASRIPISGSAYTYAYASLGELMAWIIGWDLLMEYSVGNIAVAISWSDYFTSLVTGLGFNFPLWLSMDYLSAHRGFMHASDLLTHGATLSDLSPALKDAVSAWNNAPAFLGIRIIADIPAFSIVLFISSLVYIGIRESKNASNIMVIIKLAVILLVISVGIFYVNPDNWSPFAPNGLSGVMKGTAAIFFAFIGFDAISTTAEECQNPRRDLPRAMFFALFITTILYILITLILTGMVKYDQLAVGDPLAFVFQVVDLNWVSGIISISAIVAMASVLLVFQVGQPRIWMSMSRDGLLPKRFSKIHPKFRTPSFSTVITGLIVAIPALFMNLTEVTDLTSIGTIFAFVIVSAGVLFLKPDTNNESRFRIPYYNSRFFLPPILITIIIIFAIYLPSGFSALGNFFKFQEGFEEQIPFIIFIGVGLVFGIFAVLRKFSLIPVLSILANLYLMSELGITNWLRFGIWLAVGLIIYFSYGFRKSKLNNAY